MINRLKNILLVLLALCAVTLFYFSLSLGIYGSGNVGGSVFGRVLGGEETLLAAPAQEISFAAAALPYRIAVVCEDGVFAASDAEEYELLQQRTRELFTEAIASAQRLRQISEDEFVRRLSAPALYMRYDGDIPFSLLRAWNDSAFSDTELAVRGAAVSGYGGEPLLLLTAADGSYYAMDTASSVGALNEICSGAYVPNARFASSEPALRALAPDEVLISYDTPALLSYALSRVTYTDTQELSREVLKAFSFNPYLVRVYSEADSSYVYVDEKNSLRISSGGDLSFASESAEAGGIPLNIPPAAGSTERLAFICESARAVLADIWTHSGAFGQLTLSAVERSGDGYLLVFEINLGGFAIDLDGCNAARVKTSGDVITEITVCSRTAEPFGSESFIPYAQAAAAAGVSGGSGKRLAVRYRESADGLLLPVICGVSKGE